LLVDLENAIGRLLRQGEGGEQLLKIEAAPFGRGRGQAEKPRGDSQILFVKLADLRCEVAFAGQGDVAVLRFGIFLEGRHVLLEKLASFFLLATKDEEETRVHALRRFLHVLGRDDASVIFPQDDVDRPAQPREEEDRVDADRKEDEQQRSDSEKQPAVERHHSSYLAAVVPERSATSQDVAGQ
jgi:hypothetical protein